MDGGSGTVRPGPDFELLRVAVRPEGCFGALLQDSLPFATTLERTYPLAGGVQLVKIPTGIWACKSTYYHRGGHDTYEVTDVPGHTRLLFHRGNVEADSEGCILVGSGFGLVRGSPAVTQSSLGFMEFMRRTGGRPSFILRIRQV